MDYTKNIALPPLVLYTDDLLELETLLRGQFGEGEVEIEIRATSATADSRHRTLKSTYELLATTPPDSKLDQISYVVCEKNEQGETVRCVKVSLRDRVSDVQIVSADNREWLTKVKNNVKQFIKQHQPRYWCFTRSSCPIVCCSIVLSLVMIALIVASRTYEALMFPLLLVMSATVYFAFGVRGVQFRHTPRRAFATNADAEPDFEFLALSAHAGVLAVCAFGILAFTTL